jgi:N-dimethylarginine dimethylaminohydrolase
VPGVDRGEPPGANAGGERPARPQPPGDIAGGSHRAQPQPPAWSFEGAGDALFCGDTLFAGYLIRSDVGAMQWVAEQMSCRVIPLQLVDDYYYHLDTCFCPLSPTEALYYPAAFDDYGRTALAAHIPSLITVHEDEARRFACNAVVVGKHVVLNTGCPRLEADLQAAGYTPHSTPLDEFIKAGGSAKCLTLRLDGEDAAIWAERREVAKA